MPKVFPLEFRQRALRMLEEALPEHDTEFAAVKHVSSRVGIGPETLRKWRRRQEIDSGQRSGPRVRSLRRSGL
jgi:transposase